MTEQGPAGRAETGAPAPEDERAARLAALLSVDISAPQQPAVSPTDEAEPAPAAEREAPRTPVPHLPAEDHPITEALVTDEHAVVTEAAGPTAPAAPAPSTPPPHDVGAPAAPPRPAWRTWVSFGVLFALIASGVGLAYVGTRILRGSTEGEIVSRVTDPAAPGYEALVESTPTFVVFHDRGDGVDSITVLTLPDPDGAGGGVILVPKRTVTELPVVGENPVETAYEFGDPGIGAEGVGLLLGAAIAERVVLDDARWAELVAPVAPLTIDNPNELVVDDEVRFPLGEIELAPDDVGPYLSAEVEGESDLARLFRHELFWEAWLAAVAADGTPAAVPGEIESGIGRFVRTIAAGRSLIETLPVEPVRSDAYGEETAFVSDAEAVTGLLRTLVPFPVSPMPGSRARVRVLNGTDDTSRAIAVAADLTPAGVEIVLVGNATQLDVGETTVRFAGDYRDEAEAITDILGVGEVVVEERPSDAVDITVTLGADYE